MAQDLVDIADSSFKDTRGADKQKRVKTTSSLNERLRWKTFENVG